MIGLAGVIRESIHRGQESGLNEDEVASGRLLPSLPESFPLRLDEVSRPLSHNSHGVQAIASPLRWQVHGVSLFMYSRLDFRMLAKSR